MVKWAFWRKNSEANENVPEEIQEYYESEKRERKGVAWMLALATLVVTVILALGLFYGGRWAYQAIFEDDEPTTATETGDANQADQPEAPQPTASSDADSSADSSDSEALPGDDSNDESQSGGLEESGTDSSADEAPVTGPSDLPETGPSDNL